MLTLKLPFWLADQGFRLEKLLAADPDRSWSKSYALLERFALSGPEQRFARRLLTRKRNLWLYRCDQRGFCGDFVVVDQAPPAVADRVAVVIELKANAPLQLDAGGVQLQNAAAAAGEIAAAGEVGPAPPITVCGSGAAVLAYLGG